ncbi:MAG: hypothetical protein IPG92_18465 [Flavobacteriales bacterium]|nr:hypothetical protein [Flavobacteriales bacterium]
MNSTHTVLITGGTWNNTSGSPLEFAPGSAFTWQSGSITGTTAVVIQSGLTAAINTTGTKTLHNSLVNNGTINWSGGIINAGGNIQNTAEGVLNISFAGDNQLQIALNNAGTVNYTGNGQWLTWSGARL